MGQPVTTTILESSSQSSSPSFDNVTTADQSNNFEECSADFTLSASEMPDCTSCNLVITCRGDIRSSTCSSHDSIDVGDLRDHEGSPLAPVVPPPPVYEDEGFEEDASNSTNCSTVTGVRSPTLLPASPKMLSSQPQRRPATGSNANTGKSVSKPRPAPSATKSVSTTASQTKFSYQSGTKSSSMKVAQNSTPRPAETRPSTIFARRSSVSASTEQKPTLPSRLSSGSFRLKSTPDPNGPKNNKILPTGFPIRRPPPNGIQAKPASGPENRTSITSTPTAPPTKSLSAKTRIQAVPPRSVIQRQRTSTNGASSSSSTSGSDSELRSSKNPPFRRRLTSAPTKNTVKEQAPVRKITPTKTTRNQQTSVLTIAPRASISSSRSSVRKTDGAPVVALNA